MSLFGLPPGSTYLALGAADEQLFDRERVFRVRGSRDRNGCNREIATRETSPIGRAIEIRDASSQHPHCPVYGVVVAGLALFGGNHRSLACDGFTKGQPDALE